MEKAKESKKESTMKIKMQLEENAFEQDIRELFMAFFPESVFLPAEAEEEADFLVEGQYNGGRNMYQLRVVSQPAAGSVGLVPAEPFAVDAADRGETKNRIKRRLYTMLSGYTGQRLPWGSLTGIRPVKIPEAKLAGGWPDDRILDFMKDNYFTGEAKSRLSLQIAKKERHLLSRFDYRNGYSLYIGIPFCPTTCLYCSFTSYPIDKWAGRVAEYLQVLKKELQITARTVTEKARLQTIYIGGGTPTSLSEEHLRALLEMVRHSFDLSSLMEYTVEAGRPDSITTGKLKALKEYGVTRISVNPQTMNQKTLDLIGRRHTVEQIKEVVGEARSLGFDNINMDMILGLPGELMPEVEHSLGEIELLAPDSLTVHCLALKRAARLNLEKGAYAAYPMARGSLVDELVEAAAKRAQAMGMEPYYLYRQKNIAGNLENVGYAKPDKACLYNILMMEEKHTVIGCGAGTTTKVVLAEGNRIERLENIKNIQDYLPRWEQVLEKKERFLREMRDQW